MPKPHFVVLKNRDGEPNVTPMKPWIRQNQQHLPAGMDADKTSYQHRRALRKNGWELEELPDKVLLIQPDENGDTSFADELLGVESETSENQAEITFGLERDLQAALRTNIAQLEKGLKIIDGGKERVTDAGLIDITAEDSRGNIVIIELKAGTALPEVIAQILAYMGAVIEIDKKPVRGILVAGEFHKRVVFAARAVPNLELKKYSFRFAFESVK